MSEKLKVGILGGTGMVGQRFQPERDMRTPLAIVGK